jgi:hypothetical protein
VNSPIGAAVEFCSWVVGRRRPTAAIHAAAGGTSGEAVDRKDTHRDPAKPELAADDSVICRLKSRRDKTRSAGRKCPC